MNYREYCMAVRRAQREHPEWRMGQAHFNVLQDVYPELARVIAGGPDDPFYLDSILPEFLGLVAARLG